MKRTIIACATVGIIAATAVSLGQDRGGADGSFRGGFGGRGGGREQMSLQDREAFTDARIAALHAGLKLTPDQEKMWPPVEDALHGLAKQRAEAQAARRERWASMRGGGAEMGDIPGQLRFMADRQAASADALRKLADASAPLYTSLDDGQKRRMHILARFLRPGGGMMRGGERGGERGGPMRRGDAGDGSRAFAEGRLAPAR